MKGLRGSLLVQHATFIDDLQTNVVLEILVCGAADSQVDLSFLRGDLEIPLAKHMLFALLQWHEIASVLLAHIVEL